jgi:uncharacterized Zn finger protein (UPF0148 family)
VSTNPVRSLDCPNCGAPLHHGDLNCEHCGSAIYAEHAAEVTLPALAEAQKAIPGLRRRIEHNPYDGAAYSRLGETDEMEAWARRVAELRGTPDEWERTAKEFKGQVG